MDWNFHPNPKYIARIKQDATARINQDLQYNHFKCPTANINPNPERAKNKDWRAAHKVAVIKLGGWEDREGRRRKLINIWSSWLWPYGSCCPDKEIKNRGLPLQLSGQFRRLKSTSSKLVTNTKTPANNYCYAEIKDLLNIYLKEKWGNQSNYSPGTKVFFFFFWKKPSVSKALQLYVSVVLNVLKNKVSQWN